MISSHCILIISQKFPSIVDSSKSPVKKITSEKSEMIIIIIMHSCACDAYKILSSVIQQHNNIIVMIGEPVTHPGAPKEVHLAVERCTVLFTYALSFLILPCNILHVRRCLNTASFSLSYLLCTAVSGFINKIPQTRRTWNSKTLKHCVCARVSQLRPRPQYTRYI